MEVKIIQQAGFNPMIQRYILFSVALLMLLSVVGIPLLLPWFLGLGQTISRRYYQHLRCTLTDRHLEFKKGVWFRVEKTIPLENIQDLTFVVNPLLSVLGLKILKIETAGHSEKSGADMKLIGIQQAETFKRLVLSQRESLTSRQIPANGPDPSLELLKEIRDLLKQATQPK
jgi:putative membrane protein